MTRQKLHLSSSGTWAFVPFGFAVTSVVLLGVAVAVVDVDVAMVVVEQLSLFAWGPGVGWRLDGALFTLTSSSALKHLNFLFRASFLLMDMRAASWGVTWAGSRSSGRK